MKRLRTRLRERGWRTNLVHVCEIGAACGYATAPGARFCRKHGGPQVCGICGDATCPGHDGRTGERLARS